MAGAITKTIIWISSHPTEMYFSALRKSCLSTSLLCGEDMESLFFWRRRVFNGLVGLGGTPPKGMIWEEEDWADEQDTAHRSMGE